jgi:hypothetical protein
MEMPTYGQEFIITAPEALINDRTYHIKLRAFVEVLNCYARTCILAKNALEIKTLASTLGLNDLYVEYNLWSERRNPAFSIPNNRYWYHKSPDNIGKFKNEIIYTNEPPIYSNECIELDHVINDIRDAVGKNVEIVNSNCESFAAYMHGRYREPTYVDDVREYYYSEVRGVPIVPVEVLHIDSETYKSKYITDALNIWSAKTPKSSLNLITEPDLNLIPVRETSESNSDLVSEYETLKRSLNLIPENEVKQLPGAWDYDYESYHYYWVHKLYGCHNRRNYDLSLSRCKVCNDSIKYRMLPESDNHFEFDTFSSESSGQRCTYGYYSSNLEDSETQPERLTVKDLIFDSKWRTDNKHSSLNISEREHSFLRNIKETEFIKFSNLARYKESNKMRGRSSPPLSRGGSSEKELETSHPKDSKSISSKSDTPNPNILELELESATSDEITELLERRCIRYFLLMNGISNLNRRNPGRAVDPDIEQIDPEIVFRLIKAGGISARANIGFDIEEVYIHLQRALNQNLNLREMFWKYTIAEVYIHQQRTLNQNLNLREMFWKYTIAEVYIHQQMAQGLIRLEDFSSVNEFNNQDNMSNSEAQYVMPKGLRLNEIIKGSKSLGIDFPKTLESIYHDEERRYWYLI